MGILDNITGAGNSFVGAANKFGINGFIFDVADESRVSLESEITDHYIEDGSAVQDHIALRPEKVTLRGYIGEIVYRPNGDGKSPLQKMGEKLTIVSSYLPVISKAATSIYNNLASIDFEKEGGDENTIDALLNIGGDAWDAFQNINLPTDKQSRAFIYFEALRNSKKLLTVQTPYRKYTEMAIETIKVVQDGKTRDESSFEVTLKKIRTAMVINVTQQSENSSRLLNMKLGNVGKGLVSGVKASAQSYWNSATSIFS